MSDVEFPPLPLEEWKETKQTLHLFTQIVGKVRLSHMPKTNHWWHAPLYVSARGLTTGAISHAGGSFDLEFDLIEHDLVIRCHTGRSATLPLQGNSVAAFYGTLRTELQQLGIPVRILARPFDPSKVESDVPFARDTEHGTYDPVYAHRFWTILARIEPIFREFRGRFLGKCSPVHFFWHSFDLAVTRFSGRTAPVAAEADPVTREAYSHEVISAGFWPGDAASLPEPAFYVYVHPEPAGLAEQPIRPDAAVWVPQNGTSMAVLRYDEFRRAGNPRADLLEFLESTYEAGATLAGWPVGDLELSV
jgi:hypothetical protein